MNSRATRAWQTARALVGVRYRLHGRCAAHGLDCVGLVALAYRQSGLCFAPPPVDYRLRHDDPAIIQAALTDAGFDDVGSDAPTAGDIIIQRWPMRGLHMAVATPAGIVHAHAGLRRIVETPGYPADHVVGLWRLNDGA